MAKLLIWLFLLCPVGINISLGSESSEKYHQLTNCSMTMVDVDRESSPDTFVIEFHADVLEGDSIFYSLFGCNRTRPEFKIDHVTGIITTTKWLSINKNREIFKLRILAIDNDITPPILTSCPLQIFIKDNVKTREQPSSITVGLPTNLPINSTIINSLKKDNGEIKIYRIRGGKDKRFFSINQKTGEISLKKNMDKSVGCELKFQIETKEPSKKKYTDVKIRIVQSNVEPTVLVTTPLNKSIEIPESFNDFNAKIVELEAESNINDKPHVRFQLLRGSTESKNQRMTFRLEQKNNKAVIKLSGNLDYESVQKYQLKIRVLNDENAATKMPIDILITDVNDNIPYFYGFGIKTVTIPINTILGATVTHVRAADNDATNNHNNITYKLNNYEDEFMIDEVTGRIYTRTAFDNVQTYNIEVIAFDNSPSIFYNDGAPNSAIRHLTIHVVNCPDN